MNSNGIQPPTRSDENLGVIDQIARILDSSGLNATAALYNEALSLADQGLLGAARDRLRMLICLDPDDGEAHLLLARIYSNQQRWAEALSQLDAARAAQIRIPADLLEEVEGGLKAEQSASESHSQRVASREQAELRTLRNETRRLRAENTQIIHERSTFRHRVQGWSGVSAVLAGVSLAMLGLLWFQPDRSEATDGSSVATTDVSDSTESDSLTTTAAAQPTVTTTSAIPATPATPRITTNKTLSGTTIPAEKPQATASAPKPAEKAKSAAKAARTGAGRGYTVKSGDTLSTLAQRFYGDSGEWKKIQRANATVLKGKTSLTVGQKIVIP